MPNVASDQGIGHLHTVYIRLSLSNLQTVILWVNKGEYAHGIVALDLWWCNNIPLRGKASGKSMGLLVPNRLAKSAMDSVTHPLRQGRPTWHPLARLRHSVPWKSSFFSGSKCWATWSQCLDSTSSDLDMKLSQLRVYMHRNPRSRSSTV